MTVSTTNDREDYVGTGTTGPFAYGFKIFEAEDLLVTQRSVSGVETTLTLTTDYSVTGVGNSGGGSVTLVEELADDEVLTIRRRLELVQATDIRNQGTFYPEVHEDAFDRLLMIDQQQQDELDRSLKLPETVSPEDVDPTLPVPSPNLAIVWNSDGDGLENRALDSTADVALPGDGRTVDTLTAYLANNAVFNVRDYGGVGDGVTDDAVAIAAMIAEAALVNNPILVFPRATGWASSVAQVVPAGMGVLMDAPLIYTGSGNVVALTIGAASTANSTRKFRVWVQRSSQSDWSNEGSVGIRFYLPTACGIEIVEAKGFTIGAQLVGAGGGSAYNQVDLGDLLNNKVALDLTNVTASAAIGWCNENLFQGGRFRCQTGLFNGTDRWGVRIWSQDGTNTNNNNNKFVKPSFELSSATDGTGILIVHGNQNHFDDVRSEGNLAGAEVQNASGENTIVYGFASHTYDLVDGSTVGGNVVLYSRTRYRDRFGRLLFQLRDILSNYAPYDATNINVRGCSWGGSALHKNDTSITVGADHLEFGGSRGLGIRIDTTVQKEFLLYRDIAASNAGGRVIVKCYDASDVLLTDLDAGHPYVKGSNQATFSYNAALNGGYRTGSDSTGAVYVKVTDAVKSIWIGVAGGSATVKLRGFSVFVPWSATTGVDGVQPMVTAGYAGDPEPVVNQSPQTSAVGTWVAGAFFKNATPLTGEPLGWVCTVAGSPGTWLPVGVVGTVLSGSATWDPGDLADGAGETSAGITITGAALGDFVLVSAPYDLQGITVTGYVSATDTVKIRAQNEAAGGNINLASGTWRVRVIKP